MSFNPSGSCKDCGSHVEFPGLLFCSFCQVKKAQHQQVAMINQQEQKRAAQEKIARLTEEAGKAREAHLQSFQDLVAQGVGITRINPQELLGKVDWSNIPPTQKITATEFREQYLSQPSDPILALIERFESEIEDQWSGTGRLQEKLAPAKAAREALGMACPDEGCPHFGTRHSHPADQSQAAKAHAVPSPDQQEITLQLALQKLRQENPSLVHPDQAAVRRFASAMESKLMIARMKGRSGWDDPAQCSIDHLQELLRGHLLKGDPVDVANFCMMLWNRGAKVVCP